VGLRKYKKARQKFVVHRIFWRLRKTCEINK
jgi:hypothetical protein